VRMLNGLESLRDQDSLDDDADDDADSDIDSDPDYFAIKTYYDLNGNVIEDPANYKRQMYSDFENEHPVVYKKLPKPIQPTKPAKHPIKSSSSDTKRCSSIQPQTSSPTLIADLLSIRDKFQETNPRETEVAIASSENQLLVSTGAMLPQNYTSVTVKGTTNSSLASDAGKLTSPNSHASGSGSGSISSDLTYTTNHSHSSITSNRCVACNDEEHDYGVALFCTVVFIACFPWKLNSCPGDALFSAILACFRELNSEGKLFLL
jgi:hypothetical protein